MFYIPCLWGSEVTFENTLNDLLSVLKSDLTDKNLPIRDSIVFRDVVVSSNIPNSFKPHLVAKVSQSFLNSNYIVLNKLDKNKFPYTRYVDLNLYLDQFKCVLSLSIVDPETKTLFQQINYDSKNYSAGTNSFKLSKDTHSSLLEKWMQYPQSFLIGFRTSILSLPDIKDRFLTPEFSLRGIERFSNRKAEVGFDISTIISSTSKTSAYSDFYIQSLIFLGFSSIQNYENYDNPRLITSFGFGAYTSKSILGLLGKLNLEVRLGKSYSIFSSIGYRPKSSDRFSKNGNSIRGVDYSLGVGFHFENFLF